MGMLWTVFLFWVWTHVTQSNSSSQEDNSNDGLIPLRFMDCIRSLRKENEMLVLMVVDLVYRDTVQATVAGGGLHPITKESDDVKVNKMSA
ncbi:hypothetical protein JHK85_041381 [Glycine max]|nr:hypothetical protein JHK86_040779 [Glycine max]KAG4966406.1 hypothetical protein JHK85_041381 [Glycine max]